MPSILIIEDDPLISRMYQSVFNFEKFDVTIARDGAEGLAALQEHVPTIILLDVMMPKMTGIDVLKAIKANPETATVPVIVLTNLSGQQDAEMALTLGAVKFIVKSEYKPKEVVNLVNEIIAATTRDEIPQPKVK